MSTDKGLTGKASCVMREIRRHAVVGEHLRSGGGDLLPGFGDVLFQLIERCDAQLPLNVSQLPLFGCKHLGQSLDLILYLNTHTQL